MILRTLIPGSEWLYFKLYTGIKSADRLLAETILPFTESLLKKKVIDEWFFIRYFDPKFHLRMRLKLAPGSSLDTVLHTFHDMFNPLVENGIIINIQIDCYQREIERYGENSMELSEKYFFVDSLAISKIIAHLRANGDSDQERWLIGLNLVDDTLTAGGCDLEQKTKFIESLDTAFRHEFGINSARYTKPLNSKYRDNRAKIEETMARKGFYLQHENILKEREEQLSVIFAKLRESGGYTPEQLLSSYTHMTIDRLFRSNNRLSEMVIYYLMNKYYSSHIAREKVKSNEKIPVL